MMRNKVSSSLQKTYDECFLISSTAVYFEGQNEEREALRKWRTLDERIKEFNAYGLPSGFRPRSETEKALLESIQTMHLQSQERIQLLEALQESRKESYAGRLDSSSENVATTGRISGTPRYSSERESGWLADGTVKATEYSDLPRPGPKLPPRPHAQRSQPSDASFRQIPTPPANPTPSASPTPLATPLMPTQVRRTSRTPSPEKEKKGGLRMTLRDGKKRESRSRATGQRKEGGIAASKAAAQAWGTNSRLGSSGLGQCLEDQGGSTATVDSLSQGHRGSLPETHAQRQGSAANSYVEQQRPYSTEYIRQPSPTDHPSTAGRASSSNEGARLSGHPPTYLNPFQDTYRASSESTVLRPDSARVTRSSSPDKRVPASTSRPSIPENNPNARPRYSRGESPQRRQEQRESVLPTRSNFDRRWPGSESSGQSALPPLPPPKSSKPVARKPVVNFRATQNSSTSAVKADGDRGARINRRSPRKEKETAIPADAPPTPTSSAPGDEEPLTEAEREWKERVDHLMKNLPKGVDEQAAKQIFNEIVIHGDEVHWDDVAGLDIAKNALKEAVVYPFLRPDLFMGLREPARGMLLFGPPGTGKTMLARAVATESRSTFFSISASSLTSKFLGESEKLVRALFQLAKALAPSIIFVDEIDSLLSTRSGSGEHEATRRIKTEFLIQWSDLQRAAAGSKQSTKELEKGDASRVLVLAATNLPWAIDEAARRRFVRRQYIPLPEDLVRGTQLRTLLGHQKHGLRERDIAELVRLTEGFSGSDITALAKDAAMGPLRNLGEALLYTPMDQIRPIGMPDFRASLVNIRPSVSKEGLKQFEDWAREFGERGG